MNCKWCNKKLNDSQVYEFLRGNSKGSCGNKCSMMIYHYKTVDNYNEIHKSKCIVCNNYFQRKTFSGGLVCSIKCQGVLSSIRMKENNPMFHAECRKKVSDKQKEMNYKPSIQGGNGRGATLHQLSLYNELNKYDTSFTMEYIEKTGSLAKQFNSPRHYKIDIASKHHMLAIEVDGTSHNSLKVKECDKRKTNLLNLKGWRVLRFSNSQIQTELQNCVQLVLSMI